MRGSNPNSTGQTEAYRAVHISLYINRYGDLHVIPWYSRKPPEIPLLPRRSPRDHTSGGLRAGKGSGPFFRYQRQEWKIRHKLVNILFIAVVATIADWLRQYLKLPNGIPPHDTIQHVFSWLIPNDFVIHFNLMFPIQNMSLKSFRPHRVRHPFYRSLT